MDVSAPGASTMPSVSRQKTFIIENAGILGRETKIAILTFVMMEIGDLSAAGRSGDTIGRSGDTIGRSGDAIGDVASEPDEVTKKNIRSVVTEARRVGGEVDIDLDLAAETNPAIVAHIYNIVKARRDTLNQPAKVGGN
jgi:hypothetical protein